MKKDVYQFTISGQIEYDPNQPSQLSDAMSKYTQLKAMAEKLEIPIKAEAKTARIKE